MSKCNEVPSSRKKIAKNFCINTFGCGYVFAKIATFENDAVVSVRSTQIEELITNYIAKIFLEFK